MTGSLLLSSAFTPIGVPVPSIGGALTTVGGQVPLLGEEVPPGGFPFTLLEVPVVAGGDALAFVRGTLAFVRGLVALVSGLVALVSDTLALVSCEVPLIRVPVPLVRHDVAFVGLELSRLREAVPGFTHLGIDRSLSVLLTAVGNRSVNLVLRSHPRHGPTTRFGEECPNAIRAGATRCNCG